MICNTCWARFNDIVRGERLRMAQEEWEKESEFEQKALKALGEVIRSEHSLMGDYAVSQYGALAEMHGKIASGYLKPLTVEEFLDWSVQNPCECS